MIIDDLGYKCYVYNDAAVLAVGDWTFNVEKHTEDTYIQIQDWKHSRVEFELTEREFTKFVAALLEAVVSVNSYNG